MSTHQRKIRPHATPKHRPPSDEPKVNYYQLHKYASLSYNYAEIDEEHRQFVQDAALDIRRWQRNTIEIGKTLLAVKELLPHGQFEDWWQQEFGLSERMVQSLLTVARVYGDASNPRRVAGLSDGALYLLAAPSTPETARAEVERLLIQGHAPKRAQVKAIIAAYMPTKRITANPRRVAGLLEAAPEPEPDAIYPPDSAPMAESGVTIEAEYTVIQAPVAPIGDTVMLRHELLLKMIDGAVHKVFMPFLTREEHDELLIALTRALED